MRKVADPRGVKDAIRSVGAAMYWWSGLRSARHRGKAVILAYHRVLRAEDLNEDFVQPGMYVLADVFEKQMRFLKDAFEVVPLSDLLVRWRTGAWDTGARYCAITFDDGWFDNYLYAYPILRRYGMPATVFLPTAYIGTQARFWWDELAQVLRCWHLTHVGAHEEDDLAEPWGRYPWLAHLKEEPTEERLDRILEKFKGVPEREIGEWLQATRRALGVKIPDRRTLLNWQEVQEMSGSGISFGSHSCSHRILTRLSIEEVRREVRDSRDCLAHRRISSVPVFCYPNGDYNRDVVEEVQRAGYEAAVSGRVGLESAPPDDLWVLKRIGVHNDIARTPALFALRMSGLPWA
jgi:peptidoglycan/xylan/chitin deacetylase (PgdA/CDA1 family)